MSYAVSPFPWFGGKQRLARRIVGMLPAHTTYIEPFGGAAAVLLAKAPSRLEIYNDKDEGLVTFFRVLRDRGDELVERLLLTPYARAEFAACSKTHTHGLSARLFKRHDELERARRFYVSIEQAFAGTPASRGWGGEKLGRRHGSRARTSLWRLERLESIVLRLRVVQIECLDWREMFARYDHPDAVFYLDPPYLHSTRQKSRQGGGHAYTHELDDADHADLVERIRDLQGSVLLSGYDSPLYRELERFGFERFEFDAICTSANRVYDKEKARRTEIVWRRLGSTAENRLFTASTLPTSPLAS